MKTFCQITDSGAKLLVDTVLSFIPRHNDLVSRFASTQDKTARVNQCQMNKIWRANVVQSFCRYSAWLLLLW